MTLTDEEEYGPDNPRPWDTGHATLSHTIEKGDQGRLQVNLKAIYAPHETAAVMRFQRTGRRGAVLGEAAGLRGTKISEALVKAMDEESQATARGCDIHDGLIKPGTRT